MFKHLIAILCLSKYQLFIKQKNVSSSNVFAFDKGYAHHFFKLHSFRFEQTSHLKFLRLKNSPLNFPDWHIRCFSSYLFLHCLKL